MGRKFSVQNYVKIRETGKYTQKTLNRVIESMPTLQDMTNCRQGGPDWEQDDEEEDPGHMELMMIKEENPSLYFTPSGTPMREMEVDGVSSVKRKSHKRMVSNLSNFLPFWWGMGQSDGTELGNNNTTTTVAVIEQHVKNSGDTAVDESLTLVIHNNDSSNEESTQNNDSSNEESTQSNY